MDQPDDDARILVRFATLQEATDEVQATVQFVEEQLARLDQYLAPLKQRWQGDGGSAYAAEQTSWDRAARDLNRVLGQVPPALRDARVAYARAEQQNVRVWA